MRNRCKSEAVTGEDACLGCCKGFLPPSTWLTYWQSSTKESQTAKIWPLNSIHDIFVWHIVVVLLPSLAQLFATPWTAACQASPVLTISQSLPQFNVTASVMPSSHLILWRSLLLLPSIFSNIKDFSSASAICIRWPKYWSFSFSLSPFNKYSGLITLKIDWFDLLAVQGTFRCLLQHNSKASIPRCSTFLKVRPSQLHMTTGRTIALTIQTSVSREMFLLFNTLCRN